MRTLDRELAYTALKHGIPNEALDNRREHELNKKTIPAHEKPPKDLVINDQTSGTYLSIIECFRTYVQADVEHLLNEYQEEDKDGPIGVLVGLIWRNRQWLFGKPDLVARLKKIKADEKPVCIAVGYLHCAGPDGLVDLLTAQGFKVVLNRHSPSA
jgi:hypothetical protein